MSSCIGFSDQSVLNIKCEILVFLAGRCSVTGCHYNDSRFLTEWEIVICFHPECTFVKVQQKGLCKYNKVHINAYCIARQNTEGA